MYKVLGAEICSGGDSQQQHQQQPIKNFHQKTSPPPSVSLLYPVVNNEMEQKFLGRGTAIETRETCVSTSLNVNNLGKAAVLHFALFCSWGCAKLSLPIIGHSCAYVKFSRAFHNMLPTDLLVNSTQHLRKKLTSIL
jgi:hypothetical protein